MRLVILTGSFPPMHCGVGDYVSKLAKALILEDENIEINIITSNQAEHISQTDIQRIKLFNEIEGWNLHSLIQIQQKIREIKPDLIHIQYPTSGYLYSMIPQLLPLVCSFYTKRIIQTWHDPFSNKGLIRYLPNLLTRDTVITVEENFKDYLPRWYQPFLQHKKFKYIQVASNIAPISLSQERYQNIRQQYNSCNKNLLVFFGFANPKKGIEEIFDIANSCEHHIILICELRMDNPYHRKLLSIVNSPEWKDKVFVTGFLSENQVAEILSAADAAIYPFVHGCSSRNASILAAQSQGTFVLATSQERHGYNVKKNIYYARPNDIINMKSALKNYSGIKNSQNHLIDWVTIARQHIALYRDAQSR